MPIDIELPNGFVIEDVPEDVTDDELAQEAIRQGWATSEDFWPKPDIEQAADEAVREQNEELGVMDKMAIGAGRGMTDVYQAGQQVGADIAEGVGFLDNINDVRESLGMQSYGTADEFQQQVAAEEGTYEAGLGDSTAADIGRFIGQTAPSLVVPAGGLARGGQRLAPTIKGMTQQGAATGGVAGAASQVGEDTSDILSATGKGAALGAGTAGVMGKTGDVISEHIAPRLEQSVGKRGVNLLRSSFPEKSDDEIMAMVAEDSTARNLIEAVNKGEFRKPTSISREAISGSMTPADWGTAALGFAMGDVTGGVGSLAAKRIGQTIINQPELVSYPLAAAARTTSRKAGDLLTRDADLLGRTGTAAADIGARTAYMTAGASNPEIDMIDQIIEDLNSKQQD